jgi:hypothetical protein
MTTKKEILYPFLLECCKFSTDSYWENIFEDLSYGKTPYGSYINKNFICCSYKNKEFSYKLERKDSKVLYDEIYDLLANKLGILSHKDKMKKRIIFHQTESKIKDFRQTWSNIKKKNIKDLLIERYVIGMKNGYNLSVKQTSYILSVIYLAIVFKVITSKDIEYSDGKIQYIDGVEFSDKNIIIKRDIYNINIKVSKEIMSDKKIMNSNWLKYILTLKKYGK